MREYCEEIIASRELIKSYSKGDPAPARQTPRQPPVERMDTSTVTQPQGGRGNKTKKQDGQRQGGAGNTGQRNNPQNPNAQHGATGGTQQLSQEEMQTRRDNNACFFCGEAGHMARYCPKKRQPAGGRGGRRGGHVNNVELHEAPPEEGETAREYTDRHSTQASHDSFSDSSMNPSDHNNGGSGSAVNSVSSNTWNSMPDPWYNVPDVPNPQPRNVRPRGNSQGQPQGPRGAGRSA